MTDYKILIQNTTDKKYFVMPMTDLDDSEIYYHVKGVSNRAKVYGKERTPLFEYLSKYYV